MEIAPDKTNNPQEEFEFTPSGEVDSGCFVSDAANDRGKNNNEP